MRLSTPNHTACSGITRAVTNVISKPQRFIISPRLIGWYEKCSDTPEISMKLIQMNRSHTMTHGYVNQTGSSPYTAKIS